MFRDNFFQKMWNVAASKLGFGDCFGKITSKDLIPNNLRIFEKVRRDLVEYELDIPVFMRELELA